MSSGRWHIMRCAKATTDNWVYLGLEGSVIYAPLCISAQGGFSSLKATGLAAVRNLRPPFRSMPTPSIAHPLEGLWRHQPAIIPERGSHGPASCLNATGRLA